MNESRREGRVKEKQNELERRGEVPGVEGWDLARVSKNNEGRIAVYLLWNRTVWFLFYLSCCRQESIIQVMCPFCGKIPQK